MTSVSDLTMIKKNAIKRMPVIGNKKHDKNRQVSDTKVKPSDSAAMDGKKPGKRVFGAREGKWV